MPLDYYDPVPVLAKRLTGINQVNALTGIPASTIRYWERRCPGLLMDAPGDGRRRRYRSDQFVLLLVLNELVSHLGVTVDGAAAMVETLNIRGFIKDLAEKSQVSVTRADIRSLLLGHMSNVFATPRRKSDDRNIAAPLAPKIRRETFAETSKFASEEASI